MSTFLGIDEAGRGAVIGPLVMCGVVTSASARALLIQQGVVDSKLFKRRYNDPVAKRAELASTIRHMCTYALEVADSEKVDRYVERGLLNQLEREMAETIIARLLWMSCQPHYIVLDGENIFTPLLERLKEKEPSCKIFATDKAESQYTSVAAASIVAKDHRDKLTQEIMGHFFYKGAGYPNPGTEAFIRHLWPPESYQWKAAQPEIRYSWSWYKKLEKKLQEEKPYVRP
jgi:ribonuclease HII